MNERPGNGYTLLLTPGELRGVVLQSMAQADGFEHGDGSFTGVRLAGNFKWKADITQCAEAGEQMKRLEDDAQLLAAPIGQCVSMHIPKLLTTNPYFTLVWALEA
ncbi:hypothetical protein STUTZSP0542_28340 [Stutzerimonas marianensis]